MGDTWIVCSLACCLILVIPTVILQGIGCFSIRLLFTDECGDIGLISECCFSHCNASSSDYIGPRRLSDAAYGLHITAFSVFLFSALVLIWLTCCNCRDNYHANLCVYCLGILSFFSFPIAGIFCVVGCGLVAWSKTRPENSVLGSAFYCSFVAGLYVIFQLIVFIIILIGYCCSKSEDDTATPSSAENNTQSPSGGVDNSQFSSDAVVTTEASDVATTQESGRGISTGMITRLVAAQVAIPRQAINRLNVVFGSE